MAFVSKVAFVASDSCCGTGSNPCRIFGKVSTSRAAPCSINASCSPAKLISGGMGTTTLLYMAPVSMPRSIRMMVTPDSVSPRMMAYWIGAAPRYLGSRDA